MENVQNKSVNPEYKFIIPTYNSGGNLLKCLKSLRDQDFDDWRAIVIDDSSTDGSIQTVERFFKVDPRISLITNPKRLGATYARYRGIHQSCYRDNDVCILLDGDDWLIGNKALDIIHRAYMGGAEATHGSYATTDAKPPVNAGHYPVEVQKERNYREVSWQCQHIRTFKYKYFRDIPSDHFRDNDSKWFTACTDLAIMFPVLEQIEYPGFVHIDEPIYRYDNKLRNLRDHGVEEKRRQNKLIRSKTLTLIGE